MTTETLYLRKSIYFKLKYSFSVLKIQKIDLEISDDWYNFINQFKPHLLIQYQDKIGTKYSYPIILASFVTAFHKNPVFQFVNKELIIPYENIDNLTSSGNYITDLFIEFRLENNENNDVSVTLHYETTPGVEKILV